MNIKEFSKQLCSTFDLRSVTTKYIAHTIECIIVGLTFVKIPHWDYKLYLSIYPLWLSTGKECLEMPYFQIPLLDDKGLDIYLSDSMDENLVTNAIDKCKTQFQLLAGNVLFDKLIKYFESIIATDISINSNFLLKLKIYELIYGIAVYRKDIDVACNIYRTVSNQIFQWDTKIFEYWRGDKEEYLKKLEDYELNRTVIANNICNNSMSPKIHKLSRYKITP